MHSAPRRSCPLSIVILLSALMTACPRSAPTASSDGQANATPSTTPTSAPTAQSDAVNDAAPPVPAMPSSPAASADAAIATPPTATATLVIEQVEAVCMAGLGANGKGSFSVGADLLIEVADGSSSKPEREHVFCPKRAADGGPATPKLSIWRNCRRDPACKVVSADASADRIEIVCGKDQVSLESASGRTILRGPFGEREIAPTPMKIAPPKRDLRKAFVDC